MGILFWRGRVSKAKFRRDYIAAVRKRVPQLECREADDDGELSILITGMPAHTSLTQRLDNAYKEFRKDPRERETIFSRWLDHLSALVEPRKLERAQVLPFLQSKQWLRNAYGQDSPPPAGSPSELFHDLVNDDLIACYVAFGPNIHFLTREDLTTLELSEQDARELAHCNLKARTSGRTFVDFPAGWGVNVGGNFEATMLIDEELWSDARFDGAPCVLAAVPDRNTLLASVDDTARAVWTLARMAATLEQSESYPISSQVFVRRDGRFQHLDPLIEDDEHPIPYLDKIDVSVTTNKCELAAIIIATPFGADPRSVYRLFRKFEGYLADLGCDGTPAKLAKPEDRKPKIIVRIHAGSHPDVLELLNSITSYVSERGARLQIDLKP